MSSRRRKWWWQDDIDNAVDDGYTIEEVMTTEGEFVASTLIDRGVYYNAKLLETLLTIFFIVVRVVEILRCRTTLPKYVKYTYPPPLDLV